MKRRTMGLNGWCQGSISLAGGDPLGLSAWEFRWGSRLGRAHVLAVVKNARVGVVRAIGGGVTFARLQWGLGCDRTGTSQWAMAGVALEDSPETSVWTHHKATRNKAEVGANVVRERISHRNKPSPGSKSAAAG